MAPGEPFFIVRRIRNIDRSQRLNRSAFLRENSDRIQSFIAE
jgi:hypothetical protein